MNEILDAIVDINIDTHEYGTLVEKIHSSSSSYAVFMPKLMSGIGKGNKNVWQENVSGVFANSSECEVPFSRRVSLQNFLTLNTFYGVGTGHRSDRYGYVHPGERFIIQTMYGNVKDMKIERML